MIEFHFINVTPFDIDNITISWLEDIISEEEKKLGTITYVICDDEYLLKINQDYLQHDYYTDIITFDYVKGKIISGDIFVSLPRVKDNAVNFGNTSSEELHRVLAHGILHLCGYQDKSETDQIQMTMKENHYLNILKSTHI